MSAHRRPDVTLPFVGQVCETTGRNLCVWCGTAVSGRRVSWCSDVCVRDYKIAKGDQGACRRFLWKKDRGVCQLCQTDVNKRRRELTAQFGSIYVMRRERPELYDQCRWEADHIVPLIEGGKHSADNLRTLCRCCHKDRDEASAIPPLGQAKEDLMTVLWIYGGVTAFVALYWFVMVGTERRPACQPRDLVVSTLIVAAVWPILLLMAVACVLLSLLNSIPRVSR